MGIADNHFSVQDIIKSMPSHEVWIDKHCDFGGVSDKMSLVGRKGADFLLSDSFENFACFVFRYVNHAWDGGSMQPEGYLKYFLQGEPDIEIKLFYFHRTEVRYVPTDAEACVVGGYYTCTTEPGSVFPKCPWPPECNADRRWPPESNADRRLEQALTANLLLGRGGYQRESLPKCQ